MLTPFFYDTVLPGVILAFLLYVIYDKNRESSRQKKENPPKKED